MLNSLLNSPNLPVSLTTPTAPKQGRLFLPAWPLLLFLMATRPYPCCPHPVVPTGDLIRFTSDTMKQIIVQTHNYPTAFADRCVFCLFLCSYGSWKHTDIILTLVELWGKNASCIKIHLVQIILVNLRGYNRAFFYNLIHYPKLKKIKFPAGWASVLNIWMTINRKLNHSELLSR